MNVQAAVVFEYDGPVEVRTVDLRDPGPGEVRVRMAASGVCHSDQHARVADLPLPLPLILGHEGAGIVDAVGPGVRSLDVGDAVVLSWIPACGTCRLCRRGQRHLCTRAADATREGLLLTGESPFSLDGQALHPFSMTGTLAEATVVPEAGAIRIPADMPLEEAALMGCAVLTGVGAVLNTGVVRPGDTVAVIGTGGVGLNIVQGARIAGAARIIALERFHARRLLAARLGATEVVDIGEEDAVDAVLDRTGGEGADVVFEAVGSVGTIAQAFNATRRGGTAVIVGVAPPHEEVALNAFAFPSQGKTLRGSWYGDSDGPRDIPRLVELYRAGLLELRPLLGPPFQLEDVAIAFDHMLDGHVGRAVVLPGGPLTPPSSSVH